MTRTLMAALIATGMGVGTAAGDAVIVYDLDLGTEFEVKREVVDLAKELYGETAVYDNGQQIPESIDRNIVAGQTLPAGAEPAAIPEELMGRLPQTEPNTTWVKLGEHLLEMREDGSIVMGIYDVLPAS